MTPLEKIEQTRRQVAQRDLEAKAGLTPFQDLPNELERVWKLTSTLPIPNLTLSRRKDPFTTGRAWYKSHRIHLSISLNADRATIVAVLAHEIAHLLTPGIHHGLEFWKIFEQIVKLGWGLVVNTTGKNRFVKHKSIELQIRSFFEKELLRDTL